MSPSPQTRSETGADLARGVLLILAAGFALGLGFNALQRGAGSKQALAWIREDVRLASLERSAGAAADTAAGVAEHPDAMGAPDTATGREGGAPRIEDAPGKAPAAAAAPAPAPTTPPERTTPERRAETAPPPPASGAPPAAAAGDPLPDVPKSSEPREVSFALAKRFHDAGAALFVDARSPAEFAEGHIPGARSLPFDDVFERPELARQLDPGGRPIVAYCGSADCNLSRDLAFALVEGGHRRVLVFRGGIEAWRDAGAALDTGAPAGDAP